uniref:Uncharacterized protein n=1 Tax=Pyrodinium bahamense TaxID=73915 RepID=A0A7S0AIL7_9DINO
MADGPLLPEQIVICDVDGGFCDAARLHFGRREGLEVVQGRLEDLPRMDCIVWPGNSHAVPTSGLDTALSRLAGPGVLQRVRALLAADFGDEGAPAGTAWLVAADGAGHCSPEADGASSGPPHCVVYTVVFPRSRDGPRLAMHGALEAMARHNGEAQHGALPEPPAPASAPSQVRLTWTWSRR